MGLNSELPLPHVRTVVGTAKEMAFLRPGTQEQTGTVRGNEAWLALAWQSKQLAGSQLCHSLGSSKVTNEELGKLPRAL